MESCAYLLTLPLYHLYLSAFFISAGVPNGEFPEILIAKCRSRFYCTLFLCWGRSCGRKRCVREVGLWHTLRWLEVWYRQLKIVINRCANRSRTTFDAEENFLFRSNVQWIHLGLSCYGLISSVSYDEWRINCIYNLFIIIHNHKVITKQ
jgi:hypothetical protein